MMGLGTLANVLAILAGGGLGLLLKGGLPERWQGALMRTMGLAVVFIGAAGAMPGLLRAEGGALAGTGVKDTLGMIFALALGTVSWGVDRLGRQDGTPGGLAEGQGGPGRGTASSSRALSPPPSPCASGPWRWWDRFKTACLTTRPPC
ncbi:MAG: DUF554 family protein [Lawsonibacter sp.]